MHKRIPRYRVITVTINYVNTSVIFKVKQAVKINDLQQTSHLNKYLPTYNVTSIRRHSCACAASRYQPIRMRCIRI